MKDLTEINKEHMEALRSLAQANIDISVAHSNLEKIKKEEVSYIQIREKEALISVQKVLDDSVALVREAEKNYEAIQELSNLVKSGAEELQKAHISFKTLIDAMNERYFTWEKEIQLLEEQVEDKRKRQAIELTAINSDKAQIQVARKEIELEYKKIHDQQGILARERIRLNKKI